MSLGSVGGFQMGLRDGVSGIGIGDTQQRVGGGKPGTADGGLRTGRLSCAAADELKAECGRIRCDRDSDRVEIPRNEINAALRQPRPQRLGVGEFCRLLRRVSDRERIVETGNDDRSRASSLELGDRGRQAVSGILQIESFICWTSSAEREADVITPGTDQIEAVPFAWPPTEAR